MKIQDTQATGESLKSRLCEALSVHLDPKWGSPYWLDRARRLGFDPRSEIQTARDLSRLGPTEPKELTRRPLEDFIPKSVRSQRAELIVAQTGGTLGRPAWTAYDEREFEQAFVEPFVVAARHVGFPTAGTWLYAGPSGPHIIGRAADAIARRTGAASPFMVDFDPRWAKKLRAGSFAATRYLGHVLEQALAVVRAQGIDILFATPLVLRALAAEMTRAERARIRGVHYGGMALSSEELRRFQTAVFPGAVHLAGYGNTLFGCCLELSVKPGRTLRYFPYGKRLILGIAKVERSTDAESTLAYDERPQEGSLVFTRLDRTMLLVNVLERDQARLTAPPTDGPRGFLLSGVESPSPAGPALKRTVAGLY